VFDLGSLAVTGRVHVPARNPDAILYEPVTRRVFTFDGGSANATAIDAATDSVLGTIPLDGKPEFSVADGTGTVFVNNEDKGEIKRIDARTLRVTATWPMPGCEEPSGLAMDREHRRLFSVCGNGHMEVVDADAGRVLATLPIGRGVDGVAFDPGTQLAFSSNGEGTMTVVHEESPQKFVVAATVPTRRGARTVALDPRTHRVYTVTAAFGTAPAPTAEQPHPRPPMVPGTFVVLVLEQ
jgi:DNA-binding beta-propeller fold protein YncE